MSKFGTVWISTQFEDAVADFAHKWLDTYLTQIERKLDIPVRSYDRPKSWNTLDDPELFPGEGIPAFLVVSGGLSDLVRVGGGHYQGWLNWSCIALVSACDEKATKRMAGAYGAAIRSMFIQHGTLDGAVAETELLGESYAGVIVDGRTINRHVAALEFRSYIETVVEESEGPLEPDHPEEDPPDDPGSWPVVTQVPEISLTRNIT